MVAEQCAGPVGFDIEVVVAVLLPPFVVADADGGDLTDMIIVESTPSLFFFNGTATTENPPGEVTV